MNTNFNKNGRKHYDRIRQCNCAYSGLVHGKSCSACAVAGGHSKTKAFTRELLLYKHPRAFTGCSNATQEVAKLTVEWLNRVPRYDCPGWRGGYVLSATHDAPGGVPPVSNGTPEVTGDAFGGKYHREANREIGAFDGIARGKSPIGRFHFCFPGTQLHHRTLSHLTNILLR